MLEKYNKIMLKVKVSIPGFKSQINISQFTDNDENLVKGCKFFVNCSYMDKPDFWFIIEDLESKKESCFINPKNVYFLTAETIFNNDYWLKPSKNKFLNQFEKIYSNYETNHNEIKSLPFLPWMINANHGDSIYSSHERNYTFFKNLDSLNKKKTISIITSNKTMTSEQTLRYEFAKYISKNLSHEIDWFGNGVNVLEQKWSGIAPYKYHIVLENKFSENIISEKLYDSFLGLSFPIYAGAKNIYKYFDKNSLMTINLENFEESKKIIENTIKENLYEKYYTKLLDSKLLVLDKFNIFIRLADIANENFNQKNLTRKVILKNKSIFDKKYERNNLIKKFAYQKIKKVRGSS
tara:strand:- start:1002 stop:2054 length:1053 start_codon:yes stop_codon:yes gene_type:complete